MWNSWTVYNKNSSRIIALKVLFHVIMFLLVELLLNVFHSEMTWKSDGRRISRVQRAPGSISAFSYLFHCSLKEGTLGDGRYSVRCATAAVCFWQCQCQSLGQFRLKHLKIYSMQLFCTLPSGLHTTFLSWLHQHMFWLHRTYFFMKEALRLSHLYLCQKSHH